MNINELIQCYFDSGDSLTGFVLQPVSLISMASVVQITCMFFGSGQSRCPCRNITAVAITIHGPLLNTAHCGSVCTHVLSPAPFMYCKQFVKTIRASLCRFQTILVKTDRVRPVLYPFLYVLWQSTEFLCTERYLANQANGGQLCQCPRSPCRSCSCSL